MRSPLAPEAPRHKWQGLEDRPVQHRNDVSALVRGAKKLSGQHRESLRIEISSSISSLVFASTSLIISFNVFTIVVICYRYFGVLAPLYPVILCHIRGGWDGRLSRYTPEGLGPGDHSSPRASRAPAWKSQSQIREIMNRGRFAKV